MRLNNSSNLEIIACTVILYPSIYNVFLYVTQTNFSKCNLQNIDFNLLLFYFNGVCFFDTWTQDIHTCGKYVLQYVFFHVHGYWLRECKAHFSETWWHNMGLRTCSLKCSYLHGGKNLLSVAKFFLMVWTLLTLIYTSVIFQFIHLFHANHQLSVCKLIW